MPILSVYVDGSSIIVDFGDLAINIPSGYNTAISEVVLGKNGVVYFKANGKEDFLSIESTIFGEEPNFKSFLYSIIKDKNGVGESGLREIVKCFSINGWVIT